MADPDRHRSTSATLGERRLRPQRQGAATPDLGWRWPRVNISCATCESVEAAHSKQDGHHADRRGTSAAPASAGPARQPVQVRGGRPRARPTHICVCRRGRATSRRSGTHAAGSLIATEAGAVVSDIHRTPPWTSGTVAAAGEEPGHHLCGPGRPPRTRDRSPIDRLGPGRRRRRKKGSGVGSQVSGTGWPALRAVSIDR